MTPSLWRQTTTPSTMSSSRGRHALSSTRGTGIGTPAPSGSELAGAEIDHDGRINPSVFDAHSTVGELAMKVIVTGGAGFIGANLCRMLSEEPAVETVVVIDDLSTGRRENLEGLDRIELVVGSILDSDLLAKQFDGADAVVHLAARPSVPRSLADPMATHAVNATGTMNVLEAARASGGSTGDRRLVLFGLRCQPGAPKTRGHGNPSGEPVRGEQARHRGLRPFLQKIVQPSGSRLSLLQCFWPTATS